MALSDTEVALIQTITPNLCRRLHERSYPTGGTCDGKTEVCSFCQVTAQQLADELIKSPKIAVVGKC